MIFKKPKLIQCCRCHKRYDIKDNLYEGNILICPFCGLKHQIDFKLIDNKTENLKKIDRLNLTAIDVGNTASNRAGYYDETIGTIVVKNNPANASGKITSIEIYAVTGYNLENCEVGIFYVVSSNNLSTRSTVTVGTITAGSKQTITQDSVGNPISLDVVTGDYIGIYFTSGRIEAEYSAGKAGKWVRAGDMIPVTNQTFTLSSQNETSLYGTGATAAAPAGNAIMMGINF